MSTHVIPGTTGHPAGDGKIWLRGGGRGQAIANNLAWVPGIKSIWAADDGHTLSIQLDAAFTWDQVEPEVERIISRVEYILDLITRKLT